MTSREVKNTMVDEGKFPGRPIQTVIQYGTKREGLAMKIHVAIIAFFLVIGLLSCAGGSTSGVCGDGVCSSGESYASCPDDCTDLCGNARIDDGEECDTGELGGATCLGEGFVSGTISCNVDCTLNTSLCDTTCNDLCASGDSRCSGNDLQQCAQDGGGCYVWETQTDCTQSTQICDDSTGTAQCSDTCQDACTDGETRCQSTVLQSCQMGENGCTQWKDNQDCAVNSLTCMLSGSEYACVDTCTHECTIGEGDRCDGTTSQTCTTDGNGCRVWQDIEDCSTTGRLCSAGSCTCVNECTDSTTRCSGDLRQDCVADTYGCYAWETAQDCSSTGLVCDTSSGTAQCVASCTDACSSGQTDCLGDVTRTCAMQASGCYGWDEVTNCASTSRSCSSGSCVCNDQCASGQMRCSGTVTQSCASDAYGCWYFADGTDCATLSQECVSGVCETPVVTDYTCSVTSGYESINATGTELTTDTDGDDEHYAFTIPFSFSYYGTTYTTGYLCTNGWVSFGSDPGVDILSNTTLPNTSTPNAAIYVFWDDLVYEQDVWADARLLYQTTGTSPNRVFILEWYQVYRYAYSDHKASFQLRLYEGSNAFEVSYDRANWVGSSYSATIGYEDETGTLGLDIGSTFTAPPDDDYYCVPN